MSGSARTRVVLQDQFELTLHLLSSWDAIREDFPVATTPWGYEISRGGGGVGLEDLGAAQWNCISPREGEQKEGYTELFEQI